MDTLFGHAGDFKQAINLMRLFNMQSKSLHCFFFALMLCFGAHTAFAQSCAATIESDDALRFTPDSLAIPAGCKTFTVTLQHTGRLPLLAMGHNWVLAKVSDLDGVARTGMLAGASHGYIDAKDARVLAHTEIIGGQTSATVTFNTDKLEPGERYGFVCTFAGHSPLMRGKIIQQ